MSTIISELNLIFTHFEVPQTLLIKATGAFRFQNYNERHSQDESNHVGDKLNDTQFLLCIEPTLRGKLK